MTRKVKVTAGTGNVYADMGYENPEESLTKAKIAARIYEILQLRRLTQTASAKILGIDQPRVSDLSCGRLRRFSTERLFEFLNLLDQDIEIRIMPKGKTKRAAEIRVLAA